MAVVMKPIQRLLLFHCSFTCIYLPGILLLLKYNGNLYNIGSYKFMTILLILMFAELVKLLFSILHTDSLMVNKLESHLSYKIKKSWSKYIKDIFKFCLVTTILFTIYYVTIILYGAPVFDNREETVVLTVTLTTLTFIPACLHLGIELAINIVTGAQLPKNNLLVDAIKTNIKGTLLGTWLGAIVIPLDWDRPWQAWPIPCIIGALAGYVSSHFIILLKTFPVFKTHKKLL